MKNNRQNGDALSSWISEKASKKNRASQKGASFFYWVMFALPLLQFIIFYIVVNFNSILLAFQQIVPEKIDGVTHYVSSFVGFGTIKKFLTVELVSESYLIAIKNSLVYFVFSIAAFAFATTFSAVNPKWGKSTPAGADAPNVVMPTISP